MKSQKRASTATTSINDQQENNLFIFTPTIVLIGSGALDSSGSCKLYQILCSIFLALCSPTRPPRISLCRSAYSLLALLILVSYLYLVDSLSFWPVSLGFSVRVGRMSCISELLIIIITKFIVYSIPLSFSLRLRSGLVSTIVHQASGAGTTGLCHLKLRALS